jgi:hypothetical protein
MAKHFLEMVETLTREEMNDGIQPVSIRIEVNGKADAVSKKPSFIQYFANRNHRDTHHICPHPGGSCEEEEI